VTPMVALLAFALAGAIITITPGLDTVLMLRTAILEGPRRAAAAGLGICCGLVLWGLTVAFGLGALLTVSPLAYSVLQWTGAAYLLWLGLGLLLNPRHDALQTDAPQTLRGGAGHWFVRGLLTNLLNPKVGVFYVTFLPQFVPVGVEVKPFVIALAAIHILEGALWFALPIAAARSMSCWLRNPTVARLLDRLTGAVLVGFGLRLGVEQP
jgi:threonine/homoserine/homoserine lactone efflux protein